MGPSNGNPFVSLSPGRSQNEITGPVCRLLNFFVHFLFVSFPSNSQTSPSPRQAEHTDSRQNGPAYQHGLAHFCDRSEVCQNKSTEGRRWFFLMAKIILGYAT